MHNKLDIEKISETARKILDDIGLRLYDIDFNNVSRILRVFIDREKGGVTINDCQRVSNLLSQELDRSELLNFPYTLEVSSPGIERVLKRPEHYLWAIGKCVEIDVKEKKLRGYLRKTENDGIVIATNSEENFVPYHSIIKAKVIEEIGYGKYR